MSAPRRRARRFITWSVCALATVSVAVCGPESAHAGTPPKHCVQGPDPDNPCVQGGGTGGDSVYLVFLGDNSDGSVSYWGRFDGGDATEADRRAAQAASGASCFLVTLGSGLARTVGCVN